MGRLYDLIQEHIDRQQYSPTERKLAKELGVSQTAMKAWRQPKGLVKKEHLLAIARVTRNPYSVVRDAMLEDIGYLHERGGGGDGREDRAAPMRRVR